MGFGYVDAQQCAIGLERCNNFPGMDGIGRKLNYCTVHVETLYM
jgi:hypothetical protein